MVKVIRKANTGFARLDIDKKFQHIKNAFESGLNYCEKNMRDDKYDKIRN